MVLGRLPAQGRPTVWMKVGQGPIALAVGAGGGGRHLDMFTLLYLFSSLSPPLWKTARYKLKYCLKGLLNPQQPQPHPQPTRLVFLLKVFDSSINVLTFHEISFSRTIERRLCNLVCNIRYMSSTNIVPF